MTDYAAPDADPDALVVMLTSEALRVDLLIDAAGNPNLPWERVAEIEDASHWRGTEASRSLRANLTIAEVRRAVVTNASLPFFLLTQGDVAYSFVLRRLVNEMGSRLAQKVVLSTRRKEVDALTRRVASVFGEAGMSPGQASSSASSLVGLYLTLASGEGSDRKQLATESFFPNLYHKLAEQRLLPPAACHRALVRTAEVLVAASLPPRPEAGPWLAERVLGVEQKPTPQGV